MATSRNARRKAAQARLRAKNERLSRAIAGHMRDERLALVRANLSSSRPERNYYPQSSMADLPSRSHRGYVMGMGPKHRLLSLDDKGRWR